MKSPYSTFHEKLEAGMIESSNGNRLEKQRLGDRKKSFWDNLSMMIHGKPNLGYDMKLFILKYFIETLTGEVRESQRSVSDIDWKNLNVKVAVQYSKGIRCIAENCRAMDRCGIEIKDERKLRIACEQFYNENIKQETVFHPFPMLYLFSELYGVNLFVYDQVQVWDDLSDTQISKIDLRLDSRPLCGRNFSVGLDCHYLLRVRSKEGNAKKEYWVWLREANRSNSKKKSKIRPGFFAMSISNFLIGETKNDGIRVISKEKFNMKPIFWKVFSCEITQSLRETQFEKMISIFPREVRPIPSLKLYIFLVKKSRNFEGEYEFEDIVCFIEWNRVNTVRIDPCLFFDESVFRIACTLAEDGDEAFANMESEFSRMRIDSSDEQRGYE